MKEKIEKIIEEVEEKPLMPEFSCAAFGNEELWAALKEELMTQYTPEDGEE